MSGSTKTTFLLRGVVRAGDGEGRLVMGEKGVRERQLALAGEFTGVEHTKLDFDVIW